MDGWMDCVYLRLGLGKIREKASEIGFVLFQFFFGSIVLASYEDGDLLTLQTIGIVTK